MQCQRKLVDGQRCRRKARETMQIHVHHLLPRADGGADTEDNLVHLCRQCHFEIHKAAGDFVRWGRIGGLKGGPTTASKLISIPNLKQFQGECGKERFIAWLQVKHPDRIPDFVQSN